MPASAGVNVIFNTTSTATAASTVTSAVTSQRDTYTFADGTGAGSIKAALDSNVTITSNSTTKTLSSLTNTLGGVFAYTAIKAIWLSNTASNDAITITSNISGFPACKLPPDTSMMWSSRSAGGLTIASGNTITAAGTTGNIAVITLLVS